MGRNEKPVIVDHKDLEDVAAILRHFSDRYDALSSHLLRAVGITSLTVRNWETMKASLGHIQRAVNRAYEAFDEAKIQVSRLGKGPEELTCETVSLDASIAKVKKQRPAKHNETK